MLSQTHAGAAKINRCHRRKAQEIITPSVTPDQHPWVAPLTRTWVAPLGRSATGGLSVPLERRVAAAHLRHQCHDRGPQGSELAKTYRAHIKPDDARVRAFHDDNPLGANARTRRHAGLMGSTTVCPIPHVSSTLGATADFLCAGFDHNGATASRVPWAHVHDAFPPTDGILRGDRGGYEARLDREDD